MCVLALPPHLIHSGCASLVGRRKVGRVKAAPARAVLPLPTSSLGTYAHSSPRPPSWPPTCPQDSCHLPRPLCSPSRPPIRHSSRFLCPRLPRLPRISPQRHRLPADLPRHQTVHVVPPSATGVFSTLRRTNQHTSRLQTSSSLIRYCTTG